jgi:hypothetical protein
MNKTGHFSLQLSRSSVGQQVAGSGGQPSWAPPPETLAGYPIVVSESIVNTETN